MADQKRWFKVWTSIIANGKFAEMSLEDIGRWVLLGAATALDGDRGVLEIPGGGKELCRLLRVSTLEDAKSVLARICSVIGKTCDGEFTVTWKNWNKYQEDTSAERTRKWRQSVTVQDETRREETRGEKKRINNTTTPPAIKNKKNLAWPESDLWLIQFLKKQTIIPTSDGTGLLDYCWWELTSEACGGIDPETLTREFSKIGAWLLENPSRTPRPRGWKRFLRGWLERAYDRERRSPHVH